MVIDKSGFYPVLPFIETTNNFFPNRMQEIKLQSDFADEIRMKAQFKTLPEEIDPYLNGILLREVRSVHKGGVASLDVSIENGLISCCSEVFKVMLWDPQTLDLWGELNQKESKPDPNWSFPDKTAKGQRQEQFNRVMDVIAECGITFEAKVQLTEVESDQVKKKVPKKKKESVFLTQRA